MQVSLEKSESQCQCVTQCRIDVLHRESTDVAFNFRFGNGGKIVGHHNRVGEQAGLVAMWFGETNSDAAWMVGAKHPARNHGNHDPTEDGEGLTLVYLHKPVAYF